MRNFLKSALGIKGSTTIQAMVAGFSLIGLSYYVMQSNQDRGKIQRGIQTRVTQSIIQKEIAETLSEGFTCVSTLSKVSPLTNNASIDGIYNQAGQKVFELGKEINGSKITAITLRNYVPAPGLVLHQNPSAPVSLQITVHNNEVGNASYGARDRSYQIPLLLVTFDNQVQTCVSDDGFGSAIAAYEKACDDLGGDGSNFRCNLYHGSNGYNLQAMRDNFCAGGNCSHPYAGDLCRNPNIGEHDYGNWVANGFNEDGSIQCQCLPRVCPDPSTICSGVVETNYCKTDCPPGTKTDEHCGCTEWNDYPAWSPDPSTVCPTVTLSRTRTCKTPAGAGTETETTSGTSTAPGCCAAPYLPVANAADICEGQSVVQSRVCYGVTQTQTVNGTKKCSGSDCTVLHPIGWWVDLASGATCHCAEYYQAPGSGAATSNLPEGDSKEYYGDYCQAYIKGNKFSGNGKVTLKCNKGSLEIVSSSCKAGMVE